MQKFPAEKPLETTDNKINRNIKDSVFCNLFGMPEYLMQLYQVLHIVDLIKLMINHIEPHFIIFK